MIQTIRSGYDIKRKYGERVRVRERKIERKRGSEIKRSIRTSNDFELVLKRNSVAVWSFTTSVLRFKDCEFKRRYFVILNEDKRKRIREKKGSC